MVQTRKAKTNSSNAQSIQPDNLQNELSNEQVDFMCTSLRVEHCG